MNKIGVFDIRDITIRFLNSDKSESVKKQCSSVESAYIQVKDLLATDLKRLQEYSPASYYHSFAGKIIVEYSVEGTTYAHKFARHNHIITFGDWVSNFARELKAAGMLAVVPLNRSTELHVSWDMYSAYLDFRRFQRVKDGVLAIAKMDGTVPHEKRPVRFPHRTPSGEVPLARKMLIRLTLGYIWTFSFEDHYGNNHYYYGDVDDIHRRLLKSVRSNQLPDSPLMLDTALLGLIQFYECYPEQIAKLSDIDIQNIVFVVMVATSDFYSDGIRLVRIIAKKFSSDLHVKSQLGIAVQMLDSRLSDFHSIVESIKGV